MAGSWSCSQMVFLPRQSHWRVGGESTTRGWVCSNDMLIPSRLDDLFTHPRIQLSTHLSIYPSMHSYINPVISSICPSVVPSVHHVIGDIQLGHNNYITLHSSFPGLPLSLLECTCIHMSVHWYIHSLSSYLLNTETSCVDNCLFSLWRL